MLKFNEGDIVVGKDFKLDLRWNKIRNKVFIIEGTDFCWKKECLNKAEDCCQILLKMGPFFSTSYCCAYFNHANARAQFLYHLNGNRTSLDENQEN